LSGLPNWIKAWSAFQHWPQHEFRDVDPDAFITEAGVSLGQARSGSASTAGQLVSAPQKHSEVNSIWQLHSYVNTCRQDVVLDIFTRRTSASEVFEDPARLPRVALASRWPAGLSGVK